MPKPERLAAEAVTARLKTRGIEPVSEFRGIDYPMTLRGIECGHVWTGNIHNLMYRGKGCAVCTRLKRIQRLIKLNRKQEPTK